MIPYLPLAGEESAIEGKPMRHLEKPGRASGLPLLAAASLLLLVVATTTAGEVEGLEFQHHDWLLVCDNTLTCRAAGYSEDAARGSPVSVLLTRRAGAGAPVEARVMLGQYEEAAMPPALELQIDDRQLGPVDFDRAQGTGKLSSGQLAALLRALKRDSAIVFHGKSTDSPWLLSDRGATAVLLKMDEFQGRLDTPAALVRPGTRSEDAVPAPVAAPIVRAVAPVAARPGDDRLADLPGLRPALVQSLQDPEGCPDLGDEERSMPLEVMRLDAGKLLVSTRCWMGAYNEGIGYWVVREEAPYVPELVTTSASGHEGGVIHAMQKGRGLGDCFWYGAWVWDGDRFVQTDDSSTGLCRLVAPGGAWPLSRLVRDVAR